MKTGNIGIRNLADIGVADVDPYGTNKRKYKAFEKTEKVQLRIGVFFDGTGNNRYNSDTVYYDPKYSKPPLEQDKIEKIRNFKSFVIESGSSYWNTYSNIALLHDLYEEKRKWEQDVKFQSLQMKFYIEGIGTLRDEEDDMVGSGMGEGERGVISRVEQACQNIADEIIKVFSARQKTIHKPLEIISIQFDVFGFSRGAAAARHFSNEVLKIGKDKNPGSGGNMPITEIKRPAAKKYEKIKDSLPSIQQYKKDAYKVEKDNIRVVQRFNAPERDIFIGGHLGNILQKKGINYPKYNVNVEFLGLFDTVISQMLERKGIIDATRNPITKVLAVALSPIKLKPVIGAAVEGISRIKKVNPDLSNPNIKKILQLKAETEWRDNFPITPIGPILNTTHAKEIGVLGAHSDVGGAYWQIQKELCTLHFFDLGVGASISEKQKLEQQKELLRNWYISQKLCPDDQTILYWEVMHHVRAYTLSGSMDEDLESHINKSKYLLLEKDFMGNDWYKTDGEWHYKLQGYHHKLLSKRPLNNKLSLVYMNVMKYIASTYADVPFTLPESKTKHPKEYIYPTGDGKEKDLKTYYELLKKVAEDGWVNKEGKVVTYSNLIDEKGRYHISSEMNNYLMENFVHLSANFNAPLADALDHYNFAYANVPHFTYEKEYTDPPYKREYYIPNLDTYDKS